MSRLFKLIDAALIVYRIIDLGLPVIRILVYELLTKSTVRRPVKYLVELTY